MSLFTKPTQPSPVDINRDYVAQIKDMEQLRQTALQNLRLLKLPEYKVEYEKYTMWIQTAIETATRLQEKAK